MGAARLANKKMSQHRIGCPERRTRKIQKSGFLANIYETNKKHLSIVKISIWRRMNGCIFLGGDYDHIHRDIGLFYSFSNELYGKRKTGIFCLSKCR